MVHNAPADMAHLCSPQGAQANTCAGRCLTTCCFITQNVFHNTAGGGISKLLVVYVCKKISLPIAVGPEFRNMMYVCDCISLPLLQSPNEPPPMESSPGRLADKAKLVKVWYNIDSK